VNSDSTKNSVIWDDLVYLLSETNKKGKLYFEPSLTPHLNGKLDQGEVAIEVLAPNQYIAAKGPGSKDRHGRKLSSNSISAVIRLSYHGKPLVLLPGDIDQVGLENLLEDNASLTAWLTVYPHHGGKPGRGNVKAFAARFCEAVNPKVVIFSIRDNERQFPTKEVVDTVEKNLDNVRLFSTRSSEVLGRHIEKTCSELLHQDGVGHIHLDLESLKLKFIK
jgi:competence protein ComEC